MFADEGLICEPLFRLADRSLFQNGSCCSAAGTSCRKPRKWASEPIAPPTALVWPHPLSQPSHCIEALPTHVLSAVPRSLTTCDIMSMLCKHAVAAAPVQEATAVGGLVCIALNVTGSLVILEASADASWWPTVRLLNGSVLGAVGSSCAWLSFYPHVRCGLEVIQRDV